MEELIAKINDIKTVWLNSEVVPRDLSAWGIQELDKDKVAYALDECAQLFTKLDTIDWQAPVALSMHRAKIYLLELSNFVSTRLTQPNPEKDIVGFLSNLQQLLLILRNAAVFSADKVYNAEGELLRVTSQIESAKTILQTLSKITEEVTAIKTQSETSQTKINVSEKSILESQEKITTISANVTPIEPQIKELLTKAEQTVSQISKHKEEIAQLYTQYIELRDKGSKETANLESLRKTCQQQQEEIQKTIEDASRLGMAGSFRMRKKELVKPMIIWGSLFFFGISAITLLVFFKILPLLVHDPIDWFAFLGRLPLVAPAIWLSWFSVKQYGYTVRLHEDYSFKYASAMAFEGYKREAANVSPEMLRLLMEISVINFSSNPLRVYDSTTVDSTPLHELTDDSKGILQKAFEIVKGTKDKK